MTAAFWTLGLPGLFVLLLVIGAWLAERLGWDNF